MQNNNKESATVFKPKDIVRLLNPAHEGYGEPLNIIQVNEPNEGIDKRQAGALCMMRLPSGKVIARYASEIEYWDL